MGRRGRILYRGGHRRGGGRRGAELLLYWCGHADESEVEEDSDPATREGFLVPTRPSLGDFVACALSSGPGVVRARRRFAPGGRGSRAVEIRAWRPSTSAGRGSPSSGGATRDIRVRTAATLLAPVDSEVEWPCLTSSAGAGRAAEEEAAAPQAEEGGAASPRARVGSVGPGAEVGQRGRGPAQESGSAGGEGPRSGGDSESRGKGGLAISGPVGSVQPMAGLPRPWPIPGSYLWVRRGCLDPSLGFPASRSEVRRWARRARSIQLISPPPLSPFLLRRW